MNNNSSKIQYFLIATLFPPKLLFDCKSTNEPQIFYEAQELLTKFSEKKAKEKDKLKIRSKDGFFYATVYEEKYLYLLYGSKALREEEAFKLINLTYDYLADKYDLDDDIKECSIEDQQVLTNIISNYAEEIENNHVSIKKFKKIEKPLIISNESNTTNENTLIFSNNTVIPHENKRYNNRINEKSIKLDIIEEESNNNIQQNENLLDKSHSTKNDNVNDEKKSSEKQQENILTEVNSLKNKRNSVQKLSSSETNEKIKKSNIFTPEPTKTQNQNQNSDQLGCAKIAVFIILIIVAISPIIIIPIVLSKTEGL